MASSCVLSSNFIKAIKLWIVFPTNIHTNGVNIGASKIDIAVMVTQRARFVFRTNAITFEAKPAGRTTHQNNTDCYFFGKIKALCIGEPHEGHNGNLPKKQRRYSMIRSAFSSINFREQKNLIDTESKYYM